VVVQLVGSNQDRRLCSPIRESLSVAFADQRLPGRRHLDEELVVTHQSDDLLAAVEGVLAEHLARANARKGAQLIEEEPDGRLGCRHAAALESTEPGRVVWRALLAEITARGRPPFLVVTHDQHVIDARGFAERLGLKVYGPKPCEAKMRARVELAGVLEDVPPDANVQVMPVAGAKTGEPAVIVKSDGGRRVSLLVSDVLQNNPKDSLGLLPRIMGFAEGPKIVPVFKMMFLKDKGALKRQLAEWADLPGLARLVPCHGDGVTSGASVALKAAAARI